MNYFLFDVIIIISLLFNSMYICILINMKLISKKKLKSFK